MPMRYRIDQPMADCRPAIQPDHVGLGPRLVDEDQPAWVKCRLALTPCRPRLCDVRPILLGGPQRLFFSVRPSRRNVSQIRPTLA